MEEDVLRRKRKIHRENGAVHTILLALKSRVRECQKIAQYCDVDDVSYWQDEVAEAEKAFELVRSRRIKISVADEEEEV